MHIKDLLTEESSPDRLSHTKLWSNVAHATATAVFIKQAYMGTLDYTIWLIYLGIVGAQASAQAMLQRRAEKLGADKAE